MTTDPEQSQGNISPEGQAPVAQAPQPAQPAAPVPHRPAVAPGEAEDFDFAQPQPQEEELNSFSQFIRSPAPAEVAPPPVEEGNTASIMPPQPRNLIDVGLSKAFLTDLTLKIIHYSGTPSLSQLIRRLGLNSNVVEQLISILNEEHTVEVLTQSDLYTGNYRYRLTDRGTARAAQALERSRYAGPAPVTAEQYGEAMRRFHAFKQEPSRARIKALLNELVLSTDVSDATARALYSGKSALFFGPSGNGKTSVLERFVHELDGFSIVPYAIYAYGQTIRVFDQSIHEPIEELDDADVMSGKEGRIDRRWVIIRRPAVVLGAELGAEGLEMPYDPTARFYQAPAHIKAQGGVLVIDDFGRQRIPARDLLTRLLIPLERGWDTLTLVTGEKLTAPLSLQLLFGTNINTRQLADDSLLRRILYKVEIPRPEPREFAEALRRICLQKRILVVEGGLEYVVERLYSEPRLKPRVSYARDLLEMLIESASFDGRDPVLDKQSFDAIFRMFVSQESDGSIPDDD